jgi:hypothetical protein
MMAEFPPNPQLEALMDRLADDVRPVQPLDDRPAMLVIAALLLVAVALMLTLLGLRPDLLAGLPHPMFLLRSGTLMVLALVSVVAVLAQAHPEVGSNRGRSNQGWKVAAAMAMLFPLSGAIMAMDQPGHAMAVASAASGWECLRMSLMAAALCAVPMVLHLRRGAPVAPRRAGLLVGLAAGSLGALAYNLHCPFDSMVYTGLWYGIAVGIAVLAGRLIVPHLIRW